MPIGLTGVQHMEVGLDRSLDHVGKKTFTHLARKGLNLESRCANQSEKILLLAASPLVADDAQQSLDLWPRNGVPSAKLRIAAFLNINMTYIFRAAQ